MSFYRVATEREIIAMSNWQIFCCISGLKPVYIMPDGTFSMTSRGALARLVTQDWMDKNQEFLEGKSYVEQSEIS